MQPEERSDRNQPPPPSGPAGLLQRPEGLDHGVPLMSRGRPQSTATESSRPRLITAFCNQTKISAAEGDEDGAVLPGRNEEEV